MANNYFQFKTFTIWQKEAAMKVCTDACVFGAWVTQKLKHTNYLLDIGTGTGLLALMAAQETTAKITAIEPHQPSYFAALKNVEHSPWANRIEVLPFSLANFLLEQSRKFDTIICNPPFFSNSLQSPKEEKNQSKHDYALPLAELLNSLPTLLHPEGNVFILLNTERREEVNELCKQLLLNIEEITTLHHSPTHPPFRQMYHLKKHLTKETILTRINIRNDIGEYSSEFSQLLAPYYLYL